MKSRIYRFESGDIVVYWDYVRCVHVEACIRTAPAVFDRHRRPWIDPSRATADEVVAACEACPTGALHYERKDGGPAEAIPDRNTISICTDGPLYVKGDLTIADESGDVLLKDTRAALCRCGKTRNKPFCDGAHETADFAADSALTPAALEQGGEDAPDGGTLDIRVSDPGPLLIRGSVEISGQGQTSCARVRVGALCCCGKSKNKPFCDGSHDDP